VVAAAGNWTAPQNSPIGDAHCGLRAFRKDAHVRLGLIVWTRREATRSDLAMDALWTAVTSGLLLACWRLASALYPKDDLYQKALHTLVLGQALIVAAVVVLGVANHLTGPLLLAVVALASLGIFGTACVLSHRLQPGPVDALEGSDAVFPEPPANTEAPPQPPATNRGK
jgi:hypothetical protein